MQSSRAYNNRGQNRGHHNERPQTRAVVTKVENVKMWTNHFNLDSIMDTIVYQSSIQCTPALPKNQAFKLPKFLKANSEYLSKCFGGKSYYITGEIIYSLKSLKQEEFLGDMDGYLVYAKSTGQVFALKDLDTDPAKEPEIIRFLNVVLKTFMEANNFDSYGKRGTFFSKDEAPHRLEKGISILPGFKLNIDRYLDGKLRLNIDTSFRISSTFSILHEFNEAIAYSTDMDGAKSKFTSENIVGKSFSILNDLNRMVKIMGVDPKMTLSSPCPYEGYKTMREYFEDKYEVKLKDSKQFILFSETKKRVDTPGNANKKETIIERVYYPSEILYGLGLKDAHKKNFHIMKQVGSVTKMDPAKKMKAILGCAKLFKSICPEVGLGLSKIEQTPVDTKILSAPEFSVRNNTKRANNGIIYFKEEIFHKEAQISNWAFVYEGNDGYSDDFYIEMEKAVSQMGVKIEEPYLYKMNRNPKLADFKAAVDEVQKEGCKLIFFLASKETGEFHYKKIKEYCDLRAQILTQFSIINDKVFTKKSYFEKICYQICSKLGYPLWIVEKPADLSDTAPMTMIIGADVYHNKGNESVCAVIGTTNKHFSQFVSLSHVQPKRGQEIMNNICNMVVECVQEFKAINKKVPKRILFYRDGVGDQMIDLVKKYEVEKIRESLEKEFPGAAPKLTFVLVTKRISEKIIDGQVGDFQIHNPRSGTIISTQIVKSAMEFFMTAQNVTEGTANPTRYQIILNECGYTSDALHLITFYQAFGYYGWSGAVKVPAVCQYAHKLAYHVGENYRQTNKFMKRNLFYL